MNNSITVTPPVWIFGVTLLLIVISGGGVGKSPCDYMLEDCYADAVEMHPDSIALQHSYAVGCAQQPCDAETRSAFLPLFFFVVGAVVMVGWFRREKLESWSGLAGSADTGSSAPVTPSPSPSPSPAPSTPPPAPAKKPAAKTPTPDKPAEKAPAAPSAKKSPAPAARKSTTSDDGPDESQKTFYLKALQSDEEQLKADVLDDLGHFLGSENAGLLKAAPVSDLDLVLKSMAVAAWAGPSTSRFADGKGKAASADVPAALQESTKKELSETCLGALREEIQRVSTQASLPDGLSQASVQKVSDALADTGALAGMSRCGKDGLQRLAAFLTHA